MKPLIFWSILAMLLMIGCPWLAATFAGSAGMAVCLLLFFGVNPIFCCMRRICRKGHQAAVAPSNCCRGIISGRGVAILCDG